MPGVCVSTWNTSRAEGIACNSSTLNRVPCVVLRTSTIGVTPVTTMFSSSAPTVSSPLTWALKPDCSCSPSRTSVVKPESSNLTA